MVNKTRRWSNEFNSFNGLASQPISWWSTRGSADREEGGNQENTPEGKHGGGGSVYDCQQVKESVLGNFDSCESPFVYTPISNKPPPGKPFTLQYLLCSIYFYSIYFSATSPLCFSSFLQCCPSSSSGCINWSLTSLWVPFYWITLGFNLRAHRWGFV
jgi:hypothetical protein